MSEPAETERPATPEAPVPTVATFPEARLVPVAPYGPTLAEWAERMQQGGKLGADQPYEPAPRDPGEIYPATRRVGVVEFLRTVSRRYGYERSNCLILEELDAMLHAIPCRHKTTTERHLARCLYILDGILRDASNLSLTPEAQERLRDLMVEMSRP